MRTGMGAFVTRVCTRALNGPPAAACIPLAARAHTSTAAPAAPPAGCEHRDRSKRSKRCERCSIHVARWGPPDGPLDGSAPAAANALTRGTARQRCGACRLPTDVYRSSLPLCRDCGRRAIHVRRGGRPRDADLCSRCLRAAVEVGAAARADYVPASKYACSGCVARGVAAPRMLAARARVCRDCRTGVAADARHAPRPLSTRCARIPRAGVDCAVAVALRIASGGAVRHATVASAFACHVPGCDGRARYGVAAEPTHCGAHAAADGCARGLAAAAQVPRCAAPACGRRATFRFARSGVSASHCRAHAADGMVSAARRFACAVCGTALVREARDTCADCWRHVGARKALEASVYAALRAACLFPASFDAPLPCAAPEAARLRPDFVWRLTVTPANGTATPASGTVSPPTTPSNLRVRFAGHAHTAVTGIAHAAVADAPTNTVAAGTTSSESRHFNLVLEVDEDQHRYSAPSCEVRRMHAIAEALDGEPLTIVRYNPNAFISRTRARAAVAASQRTGDARAHVAAHARLLALLRQLMAPDAAASTAADALVPRVHFLGYDTDRIAALEHVNVTLHAPALQAAPSGAPQPESRERASGHKRVHEATPHEHRVSSGSGGSSAKRARTSLGAS